MKIEIYGIYKTIRQQPNNTKNSRGQYTVFII